MRECLPPGALCADGVHARTLASALPTSLAAADVDWVAEALAARAKGELRPTRSGMVPVHAAWSSSALCAGAFAPWRTSPQRLRVSGLGPFAALRLEERLHIPHGGGTPNLDVALDPADGGALVGVEAKLTEHLAPTRPRPWRPAYRRPAMRAALTPGWRALFDELLAERWAPVHLDAAQLVRHALSLRGAGELLLVHWEPADGAAHPEVARHRAEVERMRERVGDDRPHLLVSTWSALWAAWEPELPAHVAALRARYEVAVAN